MDATTELQRYIARAYSEGKRKYADGDVLTVIKDNLKQVIIVLLLFFLIVGDFCLELNVQNNQMH